MVELHTLTPGGQTATEMAERVVAFLGGAERSLDMALYDVRLPGEPGDLVAQALGTPPPAGWRCGSPTTPTTTSG